MRREVLSVMAAAVLIGLGVAPARAILLEIVPSAQEAGPGDLVDVRLAVSGLAPPSLGVFDLDVSFDTGVLSFVSATFGDPVLGDELDLLGLGSVTAITPGPGVVNLLEVSLDPPGVLEAQQAAAFTLASLSFMAEAPGSTSLGPTIRALGAADGTPLMAELSAATVRVTGVAVVVAPASVALFAVGLAGLGATRLARRRSSNVS